jgi:hypothetical protein
MLRNYFPDYESGIERLQNVPSEQHRHPEGINHYAQVTNKDARLQQGEQ